SFGLSPQLKTNFEQIFAAPFLVELLLAELGVEKEKDLLLRLHFDGAFQYATNGVAIASAQPDAETAALAWLSKEISGKTDRKEVADLLLQTWWCLHENKPFDGGIPPVADRQAGWRKAAEGRVVE